MNKTLLILTDKDEISENLKWCTKSYQVYETNDLDFAINKIEKKEIETVIFDFDTPVLKEVINTFKLYKENKIPYIILTDDESIDFDDEETIKREFCNPYTLKKLIDNNIYKSKLEQELETYKYAGNFNPTISLSKIEKVKQRKEEFLPKLVEFRKTLKQ